MAAQNARPQLRASFADLPPVIDGEVLEDAAWAATDVATGFTQVEPDDGAPASQRTEVRVLFDARALYIGAVMWDDRPGELVVGDARRDSPLDSVDSFQVILDTFHDLQNGFVFGTNPAGIEFDAQVVNQGEGSRGGVGGGFNREWNGSWEVATRVGDFGWSAEMAIPWKTLRYAGGDDRSWGINFQRVVARRNERSYWSKVERQFDLFRVSQAGVLTGVETPRQRILQVTPYLLGELRRPAFEGADLEDDYDAGIDILKYGLTSSLTLDATFNTDFAQVEADEQQINLSRFNLFFPEKRPFFLENAGLFSVGDPGDIELFFSRRIGLEGGNVVPILGGLRLSGKVGRTNLGILDIQTDEDPLSASGADPVPSNNFGVVRVFHELPNRSRVGGLIVNRQGSGDFAATEDYNRTFALDGQVGIGPYLDFSGFAAVTRTPALDGDEHAFKLDLRYATPTWRWGVEYTEVGEEFNPEVGFLRRDDYRKPQAFVSYRWRPADLLGLKELRPRLFWNSYWNFDGFHESQFVWLASDFEWRNGANLDIGINQSLEGLRDEFEISDGVIVPAGRYEELELRVSARSNPARPVSARLFTETGGFYGGDKLTLGSGVGLRLGDYLTSELSWSFNDIDLPWGAFETNLGRLRVTYSFTTSLLLQALVQYNDVSDDVSTNLRFSWLQRANTGLFVVYNELDEFGPGAAPSADRSLIVKYSRFIDVFN